MDKNKNHINFINHTNKKIVSKQFYKIIFFIMHMSNTQGACVFSSQRSKTPIHIAPRILTSARKSKEQNWHPKLEHQSHISLLLSASSCISFLG